MVVRLPKGWALVALRDSVSSIESGVSVNGDDEPAVGLAKGVLKVSAVSEGRFLPAENKRIASTDLMRARLNPRAGCLLMSRANTPELVGSVVYVGEDYPTLFLSDKLWQISLPESGCVSAKWLAAVLASDDYRKQLMELATGSSRSMRNISQEDFLALEIPVPPRHEQRRIVAVLDASDRCIREREALVRARCQHHAQLMEKLYQSGAGHAKQTKLRSVLAESHEAGTRGDLARKLTVKLYGKGVVAKPERLSGSAETQYYVRKAGQLIYSQLDCLNGAIGIIPRGLDGFESTADLPAFDISAAVNPVWLLGYLTRPSYYTRRVDIARGQRIARRVKPRDFLDTAIRIPPRSIQDRVAAALSTSQELVELSTHLHDAVKKQKRGLMQKLLTGQWRLAGDAIAARSDRETAHA